MKYPSEYKTESKAVYKTIRSDRRTLAIQIKNGEVIVRAPWGVNDASVAKFVADNGKWIEKHLCKWKEQVKEVSQQPTITQEELKTLAKLALEIIPQRVRLYAPLVGVDYGRITIRNQRTRWGSCTADGNLNFNCLLMLTPMEVVDSVVVHELCHRKYMNHSREFYKEIERVYPEYKKWNEWLKKNGSVLLGRTEGK